MEHLEEEDKAEMIGPILSKNVFSFSNKEQLKSEGRYIIPAKIYGTRVIINVDVDNGESRDESQVQRQRDYSSGKESRADPHLSRPHPILRLQPSHRKKEHQNWGGERMKDDTGKLLNRQGPDGTPMTCFNSSRDTTLPTPAK